MLTRSGLGASITALVLVAMGGWWRYEELVVAGVALASVLGVALWSARVDHSAEITRRIATPRVARGEAIRLTYRLHNARPRRTAARLIVDRCDDHDVAVAVPPIEPESRVEVSDEIATSRRGIHPVGPLIVERRDPFGLAIGRRPTDEIGLVIVHPKVHVLAGPYGAMHIVEHDAILRRVASDPMSGFVSLRDYVQGDDPRMIHWPTTARMGTLMVREHVELRRPEFTIVLDTSDDVATPDDFEEMVDVAASVAVHAIRSGVDATVRTTSRHHPGSVRPIADEALVLDLLTPVSQTPDHEAMTVADVFRAGIEHTAIVVITGPHGPHSTTATRDSMSIVRVGHGAELAPGIAHAVDDAETFAQRWRPWR